MVTRKVFRQTVGASAAVVLAAVVNAAVASPVVAQTMTVATSQQATLAGDLSWAVSGATASAQSTRSLLAEKALQTIQSLDRLNGTCGTPYICDSYETVLPSVEVLRVISPDALRHTESSHQYSAP